MPTALHPQTIMAFHLSDEILPRKYGYPFKIRVPTKLGFKNPKFVTTIYVTNVNGRAASGPIAATIGSAAYEPAPSDLRHGGDGQGAAPEPREDAPGAAADGGRGSVAHRELPARHHREHPRSEPVGLARTAIVAYAPAGSEALFDGMLAAGTRLVLADGSDRRRRRASTASAGRCSMRRRRCWQQGYGAVCLVNSDSPTLPTAYLEHAAAALARPGDRMVLGVSDDGGYYLIGLKAPHAVLFQDIAWSTDEVSTQTLARAATAGLDVVALPLWFDVDDAASLARLMDDLGRPAGIDPTPYAAPATRWWAEELGYARIGRQAGRDAENPRPLVGLGREAHQG